MSNKPLTLRATFRILVLSTACVLMATGLASYYLVRAATAPSYSSDVAPILKRNCLSCHSATQHKSGFMIDSYSALMKGGKHGAVIVPHDAKASRIIQLLEGDEDPQMPLESDPLPEAQIAIVKAWINAGAGDSPAVDEAHAAAQKLSQIPEIRPEVPVTSPVTTVKFSPSGNVIAAGGYREVRLIDPVTGNVLATLVGHADYVRSIAFSPDGKMLAAAGGSQARGGEIKIWDVQSHQLLRTFAGHQDSIYSVAWSPDGKLIASGSYDKTAKLWDAETGKELFALQDHIDAVFSVAFSPDGKRLATASQDRTVKIWNVGTGRRLYTLSDALDGLTGVAYSPDGSEIAAAGYDKTIYVWKLAEDEGHLRQSLIADQDSILAIAWAGDAQTLVTASSDGSIRLRNPATLDLTSVLDRQPDWVETLDLSPDGKWLAAGRYNGSLSLYNVATAKEVRAMNLVFGGPQVVAANEARK